MLMVDYNEKKFKETIHCETVKKWMQMVLGELKD